MMGALAALEVLHDSSRLRSHAKCPQFQSASLSLDLTQTDYADAVKLAQDDPTVFHSVTWLMLWLGRRRRSRRGFRSAI